MPQKLKPSPICRTCNKEFRPKREGRRKLSTYKFCSNKCKGQSMSTDPLLRARLIRISKLGRAGWTESSITGFRKKMTGANHPGWKGGVTLVSSKGNYSGINIVKCPKEFLPMARKNGYIAEHRLIVAQAVGRCLLTSEVVHHINHDPKDNRLSNLMLFSTNSDHKKFEATGIPLPLWVAEEFCKS